MKAITATTNRRINQFAERLVHMIFEDGPTVQKEDGTTEAGPWSEEQIIALIRREASQPEWQEPAIAPYMVLSVYHLSQTAKDWMAEQADSNIAIDASEIDLLGETATGWFVVIPDFNGDHDPAFTFPPELETIFRFVLDHDCGAILFDANADTVPGLAFYEADGRIAFDDVAAHGPLEWPLDAPQDDGGLADELATPAEIAMLDIRDIKVTPDPAAEIMVRFASTGAAALDKKGHIVIGRTQAQTLKRAIDALLSDVNDEIEQRQTSGNDDYWKPLQAKADALLAARMVLG